MNLPRLHHILLLSFFLAHLTHAGQQPAPSTAAERVPLRLGETMQSGMREIGATTLEGGSIAHTMERLRTFRHSATTMAAFKEMLGTERPWTLDRRGSAPERTSYRWRLNPTRYASPNGDAYTWSALPVDVTAARQGRQVSYRGAWQSFTYENKITRIALRDLTFKGTHQAEGDLWYSDVEGAIGMVQFGSKNSSIGRNDAPRMGEI